MPPYAGAKSKGVKARDGRRSRSRNTTPSSIISAPAVAGPAITPYLELDTSKLLVITPSLYVDILEKLESKSSNLDTKQFQDIISQLNSLGDGAEKRSDLCSAAMRTLHEQYAELEAEQKEKERQAEQARKLKARQDARAAEVAAASQKSGKLKKRKGDFEGVEIKREGEFNMMFTSNALLHVWLVTAPTPTNISLVKHTVALRELVHPQNAPADLACRRRRETESLESNRYLNSLRQSLALEENPLESRYLTTF